MQIGNTSALERAAKALHLFYNESTDRTTLWENESIDWHQEIRNDARKIILAFLGEDEPKPIPTTQTGSVAPYITLSDSD
jgi:hypothetical protein